MIDFVKDTRYYLARYPESSWSKKRISGNRSLAYPAFFGAACPVFARYLLKFAIDNSILIFCRIPEIIKKKISLVH